MKTIGDIRALGPCYDPARYLPEDWQGTALDILAVEACPPQDRLWVVLHEGWIDDRTARLFAAWCARQALARTGNPDPRSVAACDVAERYANGQATKEELSDARDAAAAALTAPSDPAYVAAYAAVYAAAAYAAAAYVAAYAAVYAAAAYVPRDVWFAQIARIAHLRELLEARP